MKHEVLHFLLFVFTSFSHQSIADMKTLHSTRELLSAVTNFVPFAPYLNKKERPDNVFDQLDMSGIFWNQLFQLGNLNVTIKEVGLVGHCVWDPIHKLSNCTGIFEQIASGDVDFPIFNVEFEGYENNDLISNIEFGLMTSQLDQVFLSTPERLEQQIEISPLRTMGQIPMLSVILAMLVLGIISCIFNYNNKRKRREATFSVLDTIVLHALKAPKTFEATHRRIILFSLLIYCFFSYVYYASNFSSNLIVDLFYLMPEIESHPVRNICVVKIIGKL